MNGKQFLNEKSRRDDLKDIPVVILSTSSDAETISETTRLGAKYFVTKPDKFAGWEESLRQVFINPGFSD
jgi:DNA-binding NarL/FixJ family response regulator